MQMVNSHRQGECIEGKSVERKLGVLSSDSAYTKPILCLCVCPFTITKREDKGMVDKYESSPFRFVTNPRPFSTPLFTAI